MKREKVKSAHAKYTPLMNLASVLLTIYCMVVVYMLLFLIMNSFKTKEDLIYNTMWIPKEFTWENVKKVIFEDHFLRSLRNSIIITASSVLGVVTMASMTAYGLTRYKFKLQGVLKTYFILGMMFPLQLGILPLFIMMRNLNLINSYFSMILLHTASISLPVFIFSTFFKTLPYALYESARIDGAGEFLIYLKIMMPLSKPIILTQALLTIIGVWNSFFFPMVFLQRENMHTVTLVVYKYMTALAQKWGSAFPAATMAVLPVVIVFVFFSEQIISGIAQGAIKQ